MNTTTTLSRYNQDDPSDEREDSVRMEDNQITQVVSCIVRPDDAPQQQSREVREQLIRNHIEGID